MDHTERVKFPTWSIPTESQVPIWSTRCDRAKFPTWSTTTYFTRVRCTTRDTGCLPVDSLRTPSTVNFEMKHRERHVCSKDQKGQGETRVQPQKHNTGRHHERPSIVTHIRTDITREYRISVHLRIVNTASQYNSGYVRDRHDTSRV